MTPSAASAAIGSADLGQDEGEDVWRRVGHGGGLSPDAARNAIAGMRREARLPYASTIHATSEDAWRRRGIRHSGATHATAPMDALPLCLVLLMAGIAAMPPAAQDYPTRPVRIVTDSAPGSAIDVILRIVADRLTQMWGQQVVAVNHPGAGGSIAARVAAQAAPDGYTLFIPALSTFVAPPGAAANLPIDGAARFSAGRLFRRRADVHHRRVLARRRRHCRN